MVSSIVFCNFTIFIIKLLKISFPFLCIKHINKIANIDYRLQLRFLSPLSFLHGPSLLSCEKEHIIGHLSKNCTHYNLVECSGSGKTCFSGNIIIEGFSGKKCSTFMMKWTLLLTLANLTAITSTTSVYFFIAWHESLKSAFDIFVLCVTEDQVLDAYITKEGSPFVEQISDIILYSTMTEVQELISKVSKEIRKQYLWDLLGNHYDESKSSILNLSSSFDELREKSYHIDLESADARLKLLFRDELNDICIPW